MSEKDTSHDEWMEETEPGSSKTIDLAEWLHKNHAYLEKRAREKADRQSHTNLISEIEDENKASTTSESADSNLNSEELEHPTEELLDDDSTIDKEEIEEQTEVELTDSEKNADISKTDLESETKAADDEGFEEETDKPENEEEPSEDAAETVAVDSEVLDAKETAKIRRQAKRTSSRRRLNPKQKRLMRLTALMMGSLVVMLIAGYFVSPWSKVKNITVEGQNQVSQEDVLANTGLYQTDYTFSTLLRQKQVEQSIKKQLVWVKDAQITYQFPADFKITLEEHQVIGYVKDGSTYYPVLSSGDTIDSEVAAETLPDQFLLFDVTDLNRIKEFVVNLSQLEEASPLSRFLSVKLTPTNATEDLLTIDTVEGHTILVPLSEVVEKLPYYEKVIKDLYVPSYIDMEAGIFTYAK